MQKPRLKLVLLLAALAVPVPLVAMCQGSQVDIPRMEDEIAADISSKLGVEGVVVDCPAEVDWSVGDDFKCLADLGEQQVAVLVTMQDEDGQYLYEVT